MLPVFWIVLALTFNADGTPDIETAPNGLVFETRAACEDKLPGLFHYNRNNPEKPVFWCQAVVPLGPDESA